MNKDLCKILFNIIMIFACVQNQFIFSIPNGLYEYVNPSDNQSAYVLVHLHDQIESIDKALANYERAIFDFQTVLATAKKRSKPVVLIIPEIINIPPLSAQAAFIEGARVSVAWASAYCRFKELGNINIRIIQITNIDNLTPAKIYSLIDQSLLYKLPGASNPEEDVAQRIFKDTDFRCDQPHTQGSLVEMTVSSSSKEEKHIKPSFKNNTTTFLITGACGFLGSYITKKFLEEGYNIIGIDNFFCCRKENLNSLLNYENFNFFDVDASQPFDVEGNINAVIHLASVPSPYFYYNFPLETMSTGLWATKETLELARRKNARYFFASTSEVYGDPLVTPQPEEYEGRVSAHGKRSQYDQSKRGAETLLWLYFQRYSMDIRVVRIFNTYGPGMRLDDGRVVTNFIRAALENKPMIMYGNGNQSRSFAYISDTAQGIMQIITSDAIRIEDPIEQRVFNIGNPYEFTVAELAEKLNKICDKYLGRTVPIVTTSSIDTTDPQMRCPNITRAQKVLNYEPRVSLEEGLEKTFLHFLNNRS